MFQEKVPGDLERERVDVLDGSGEPYPAMAAIRRWTSRQAFWRGFRRALRIVGTVFLCILPLAVLEPFLFMLWGGGGTLILLGIVGPYFHMKYWDERESFFFVEGECPSCHVRGQLTPYVSTAYTEEFTVLCPGCGQTFRTRPV
jgi:hypothetical protein